VGTDLEASACGQGLLGEYWTLAPLLLWTELVYIDQPEVQLARHLAAATDQRVAGEEVGFGFLNLELKPVTLKQILANLELGRERAVWALTVDDGASVVSGGWEIHWRDAPLH